MAGKAKDLGWEIEADLNNDIMEATIQAKPILLTYTYPRFQ